jgi:N utilization substance protein A
MNKEILMVVDAVSNEKGVEKDVIFEALEAALAMATKKKYTEDVDVRVAVDRESGDSSTFRRWKVIADDAVMETPDREIRLMDALDQNPDFKVDEYVEEPIESVLFGRIAAQTAKQVIVQKVREAEREQVVTAYLERKGELLTGVVKRLDKGNIILDLGGNVEALVTRDELIPREAVRPGDRLRGWLKDVRHEVRGPQLFVSRTAPQFLIELFKLEVPEVGEGLIEIMGAARDPGARAKIAVRSNDPRIDPVGACVGMRGSRVRAISNELAGERVDIILWNENPAQYVINAMAPAEVASILVDEEAHSMDIAVEDATLAQAIGRAGQNVRLASELTGWVLNVMDKSSASKKGEQETEGAKKTFMEQLGVDEEVASILVQEGFSTIEEIAYVPVQEMLDIEEFDEQIVEELRSRAKDFIVTRAIAQQQRGGDVGPAQDLLDMEGMDQQLATALAGKGVRTMEDLAEQSVDELADIDGLDAERAAQLIMRAREPWFAAQQ